MVARLRLVPLVVLVALWCAGPAVAAAPEVYVDDVHLSRGEAGRLVLDFRVHGAMDQRVVDTLESGLAVRFTYWVRVQKPLRFKPDETLFERRFERILEKDNLAERYRLTMGEGEPPREFSDLEETVARMSRVEGLELLPAEALETNPPLHLRIRARVQRFELPFRLHYVLPFISYLDVGTDWLDRQLPSSAGQLP